MESRQHEARNGIARRLLSLCLVLLLCEAWKENSCAQEIRRLPATQDQYQPSDFDFDREQLSAAGEVTPAAYQGEKIPAETDRYAALEKRVKDLEKEAKANSKKPVLGEWEDMSNDKWNVKMGGHVQLDYINWAQASPNIVGDQNYFEFRRLRLFAEGTGYGVYDFRLQFTLEPETVGESGGAATTPDVKDAYFSANEVPILGRWRIGNFFVPYGLEQLTTGPNLEFLERSIPTETVFDAGREVGTAFYQCSENMNATLSGGIFFDGISDTLKERIDDNQGCRLSSRATWLPYYDEPSDGRYLMHTGIGVLYTDDQNDIARFRARPEIHEGPRLIDSGNIAATDYTSGNLEFAIVNGPFTIQSEAYLCSINRIGSDPVTINGCYVHSSYFLTGEHRVYERFGRHGAAFGRTVPFTNFFWTRGAGCGSGAWELKARWTHLDLNNLNQGQYNDMTFGFNWYWNDRTRIQFDWIHPITSSTTNPFGAVTADIIGMRFDFNW